MDLKLTPQNVETVGLDCLYQDDSLKEPPVDAVKAEGIVRTYAFDPAKLAKHKEAIDALLDQLHPSFAEGWSFLSMCQDKDDRQWTGLHVVMELLMCLGLATGRVRYCLPKEMWKALPGGVPYIIVKPREEVASESTDRPVDAGA